MKLGITEKLFLAFLFSSFVVVATMAIAVRYSFQHGFLDYVNHVEVERMDSLATTIAAEYEKFGDWQFVKFKHGIWDRLINPYLIANKNKLIGNVDQEEKEDSLTHDFTDLNLRLALLTAEKEFVAGKRDYGSDAVLKPIYSNRKIIGWLSITPSSVLTDTVDIKFKEQQGDAAMMISFISIFFAAGIAILLARNLLKPIKRLALGTRALIVGNFSERINVTNDDEIGQLQVDFNLLADTLEQNQEARRQWIADISHELRTPMAVLLGEVEAIIDNVREPNSKNIKSLHTEIMRVNSLIEDLYQLSLSDIGALEYYKESMEVTGVISDVVDSFSKQLQQKNITTRLDLDSCHNVTINADSYRLRQLFTNLLRNTLAYTDVNGVLEIVCEQNADQLVVHWKDSEPGVTDEMLGKLFERLYRAEESRNRANGGAGLGLSISKSIVQAHEGIIAVLHSQMGGLWFKVVFPLDKLSHAKTTKQQPNLINKQLIEV